MTAIPDIVDFLKRYPPFAELDNSAVEELASAVEVEFHPAGEIIFSKGDQIIDVLRVIRAGAVEVVSGGQVLDLMGPGEMFGHASMLSGLPTGFEARAAEDTLAYRIRGDVAARVLAEPRALRYVTRLLLEDPHHLRAGPPIDVVRDRLREPVQGVIHSAPIIVAPTTSVREAAMRLTEAGATAFVVDLGQTVGIVTDSDLRSRVLAAGLPADSPVSTVMTAPAATVPGERSGSEVLLDMLDRGFRHFPVVSSTGRVIGIVEDHDLVELQSRSSFLLRRAVARASTADDLESTSRQLRPAVISMSRSGMSATDVMSVFSVVADAITRRAIELTIAQVGEAPSRYAWLALGSQARREALPSSDLDSAIAWFDHEGADEPATRTYLGEVATAVTNVLERCGFRPDEHRASASDPLFARSLSSWRHEARSFLDDPTQEKAQVIVSVLVDSRPVWGIDAGPLIAETFSLARTRPRFLRLLAEFALAHRPPVGFFGGLVVEHSGESRGQLDLKSGAVVPITDLARWAGMTAGVTCASTPERLRAARNAGTFTESDALTLHDAFELVCQLRLDHQVRQLESGAEPDDTVNLDELSPLTRSYLKEAFRAIASVQKRISSDLTWAD